MKDSPQPQAKASEWLMIVSYIVAAVALALSSTLDFGLVVLLAVGVPTGLGFVRHVILWRGDAVRLGFDTPDPSWMWEVGFANLAICVAAIASFLLPDGQQAQAMVALTMAVYMYGAAFVHAVNLRRKGHVPGRNPIIVIGGPLAYAIALSVLVALGLT